jgi:hypothetical protein
MHRHRISPQALHDWLAIVQSELCSELLPALTLPAKNDGIFFVLSFHAVDRLVSSEIAVKGQGRNDAGNRTTSMQIH